MKRKFQEKEGANKHMDKFTFQTALARKTDISCVQAFHTYAEIERMIEAAIKYHFAAVFTLPAFSSYVAKKLRPFPEIHTGGVISFPSGGDTSIQKMAPGGRTVGNRMPGTGHGDESDRFQKSGI